MPCRIVVEGHVATVRVTLADAEGFHEFFTSFARQEPPGPRDPETLRASLEVELTDEARRLLESEDVTVELKWKPGSLEIAAIIAAGKIVADVGSFLGGVRAIRDLFPQRMRDRVSGWLGREVATSDALVEIGSGLLRSDAEADAKAGTKGDAGAAGVRELVMYALLTLAVLLVVAGAVIGGLALLIEQ
jgi:hypothetical protein